MAASRGVTESGAESPAETGRRLIRAARQATLATSQRDAAPWSEEGWPYPSLVLVATDPAGCPLLLVSGLADHTKNLFADARAGLLFDGTGGLDEPLTGSRLSVLGRMEPVEEPALLARYLARHPSAAAYAGFGDFRLWRMVPQRAHLVAGFGRIHWVEGSALLAEESVWRPLAEAADDIIAHMNEDHADALALYATVLMGAQPGEWRMSGIDPDGCDLTMGPVSIRLAFGRRIGTAEAARAELVRLVREARSALSPTATA